MELNVPTLSPGIARQGAIYLAGMAQGRKPVMPLRPEALEQAAQAKLSPEAFAYIAGGAGREATMSANLAAFERRRIVPRMLRNVSTRSLRTDLLGQSRPHPLLAAPIGVQELAHPEADLAAARACASLDVPFVISNQSSHSMEAIAAAMGDAPRWFQLYWSKSDELVASLVRRAEACGCEAIVVTLDTTMLGWRTRDLELGYLPFLQGRGIAQYTSDPVFRAMLGEAADDRQAAAMLFMQIYSNPAVTWERLAFLRQHTKLPILLKGINHVSDADAALDAGMDGIIVSNHGGRQLDGGIAALDALESIARSHAGRLPILFDSGVRTGADIFKALAAGADAVLIGRPYVYGLALEGQAGVAEVLQNLLAEFDLSMGLAGCSNCAEIRKEAVLF
jgi:lactate 2-monooxygenase